MDFLSHDTRYSIRRSLKVFNNEIIIESAQDSKKALEILDELITLYNKEWHKHGRRGMFSSKSFTGFQKEIIKKLIKSGSIIMIRIKNKKYGTLGCIYILASENVAYGYQIGLNYFDHVNFDSINKKRLRIGFIVHLFSMYKCLENGLNAYNFSTGSDSYKKELTNGSDEVMTISVTNNFKPVIRNKIMDIYWNLNKNKTASILGKLIHKVINKGN